MPNVNNIFRRGKVKKLNLERFDVFLEEQASLGPLVVSQYFNISRFPSVLPGGNSYFEIEGSKLLKPEVELKTELLDSSGQPIFHYALPKSPKSKKLKVTMQTASNVSNGVGRLIILGELNPNLIDVPEEFQDTYNYITTKHRKYRIFYTTKNDCRRTSQGSNRITFRCRYYVCNKRRNSYNDR